MKAMIILTTALLLGASVCRAEDAPATPAPQVEATPAAVPPASPAKFYLEVDQADLQAISAGINELPKRVADPLVLKLNAQLQAQQTIVAAKEAVEKAKKGKK